MNSKKWSKVKTFAVRTPSGDTRVELLANGNMQVEIIVDILLVDENDFPVSLSEIDLDHLHLADYNNAAATARGWGFSRVENQFMHSLNAASVKSAPGPLQGTQSFSYWVSTTAVDDFIAVGAKFQVENGVWISTSDPEFNSHVTCVALPAVEYTTANTTLPRDETAHSETYPDGMHFDQDNYYLTLGNGNNIVRVDWMYGSMNSFYRFNSSDPSKTREGFAWKLTDDQTQTIQFEFEGQVDEYAITVNNKPGKVTFTRMLYENMNTQSIEWEEVFENPVYFTLYDQFGNSGSFSVTPKSSDGGNTLVLNNY